MDSKSLEDQVVTKPYRFTEERMIEAIKAAEGNKSAAARMLDCDRRTITRYIERSDKVKEAFEEEVQGTIDAAENRIGELMKQDEDKHVAYRAAELILMTIGKDRGYFKKQQGQNISANVVNVLNQVFPKIENGEEVDEEELDQIIEAEFEDEDN